MRAESIDDAEIHAARTVVGGAHVEALGEGDEADVDKLLVVPQRHLVPAHPRVFVEVTRERFGDARVEGLLRNLLLFAAEGRIGEIDAPLPFRDEVHARGLGEHGLVVEATGVGEDGDVKVPLEIAVLGDVHRFPLRHPDLIRQWAHFPAGPDAERLSVFEGALRRDKRGAVIDDEGRVLGDAGEGDGFDEVLIPIVQGDLDAGERPRDADFQRLVGGEFAHRVGAIDEMGLDHPPRIRQLRFGVRSGQLKHEDVASPAQ